MSELLEHVARNRGYWDDLARQYVEAGERGWARVEPAYPDASFGFAISEYGACLWADPQHWVPEAGRLLRPGGQLVFLTNSFLMTLCVPSEDGVAATERLLRPAFGMYQLRQALIPGRFLMARWSRNTNESSLFPSGVFMARPKGICTYYAWPLSGSSRFWF